MQLILGTSNDGVVSLHPTDDMKWLGPDDKRVFKLLSLCSEFPLAVSDKTAKSMPKLIGRNLVCLSRNGITLQDYYNWFPNGILIGGLTIAQIAVDLGFINRAHICRSDVILPKDLNAEYQYDTLTKHFKDWQLVKTTVGKTIVETYIKE